MTGELHARENDITRNHTVPIFHPRQSPWLTDAISAIEAGFQSNRCSADLSDLVALQSGRIQSGIIVVRFEERIQFCDEAAPAACH